ncbi:hypothetical protein HK105_200061 [Polyrhizophydium stewartii]|uniref:Ankyrin repeat protein n=1 Tax=Polyrhizophydium stewartii TaxID=2732419 RepID=A0ABR4NKI5_9FUNG
MHGRLSARLPWTTEANTEFGRADAELNAYMGDAVQFAGSSQFQALGKHSQRAGLRLLHAAMRNMWLDLADVDRAPIARAGDCIEAGHAAMLAHLAATGRVDLARIQWVPNHVQQRFDLALNVAAANGHAAVLRVLHDGGCRAMSRRAAELAAAHGHLDCLEALRGMGVKMGGDAMEAAARGGHLDVVRFLHGAGVPPGPRAANVAAAGGHVDTVAFLVGAGGECTTLAMDWAAAGGHVRMLEWLHARGIGGFTHKAMDAAAANGHLGAVAFLHGVGGQCSPRAMDAAASNGHLAVVEFLHGVGAACTAAALEGAARGGHGEVLRWLLSNRGERCTPRVVQCAAEGGHLDLLGAHKTVK